MTRDDDIYRWMEEQLDYNETFRGDKINEEKLEKLNKMKKLCKHLAMIDPRIEAPFMPFDKTCGDGMAQISLPRLCVMRDRDEQHVIAYLIDTSDEVVFSAVNEDRVLISFILFGMWDEFHHEGYDEDDS